LIDDYGVQTPDIPRSVKNREFGILVDLHGMPNAGDITASR
jgi:hypothetical protein